MDAVTEHVVGRVAGIAVYPVRSAAASAVRQAQVTATGLAGDRAWTVLDADGAPVRGKDAPELARVAVTGSPDVDEPVLAAALGRPVTLAPAAPGTAGAPVHLVGRGALERAAHGDVPGGCSADDPRANLLVEVDGDERTWVGRTLVVGGAVLRVSRTPKHCLGVYAEVRRPGQIAVGDAVLLQPRP